ncbi:hypothetical protein [Patulibacter americanus]|uniref:hypothetical protein n=1 Tax=Patulibacter americanus TaxID=588672 RepID=UPI0003B7AEA6|nr:hypothetical protein [Patulibacter americanus]
MADRKRKRKQRPTAPAARPAASAPESGASPAAAPERSAEEAGGRDAMRRGYAKAEQKNIAAREALQPISTANRPGIVLVACAWLLVACASIVYSLITADGKGVAAQRGSNALVLVIIVMAIVGTWQLKAWAILGTQTILALACVFTILAAALMPDLLVALLLVASALVSGAIFYRMINVLARVQKAEHIRRGTLPVDVPPDVDGR